MGRGNQMIEYKRHRYRPEDGAENDNQIDSFERGSAHEDKQNRQMQKHQNQEGTKFFNQQGSCQINPEKQA